MTEKDRKLAYDFLFSAAMRHSEEIATTMRWEDIVPFYQGLFKESDRSMGILGFSYIESQLQEMFGRQLDPKVKDGIKSIIGYAGILDSVGKQIKMLRALRWIRPETEHDLRLLSRIRNRFAHAHSALTFDDEEIRGFFNSLSKYEENAERLDFPKDVKLQTRHKYLIRVIGTLFALYHDLTLMPSSIRAGMGPTGAFGGDFDKFPPALKNALTACMEIMGLIYDEAAREK